MSKPIKLSVALATFNEEANIKDCLQSIKGLADEIIVYDESSTDKTREIAKSLGARVFKVKHEPIFHLTKNKAIRKCTGDWVLQLDADERVTPTLEREIKQVLTGKYFGFSDWQAQMPYTAAQPPVAFWLKRQNFFLGRYLKKSGQYPDPVIRLFKKGLGILPAKDVHEQVAVKGPTSYLKNDLDHYATPNFSRYLTRENTYSSLHAKELLNQGVSINILNTLNYLILKPLVTFVLIFFRHKGFQDGFPGFVFALFSGLHHSLSYMKLWELKRK